MTSFFISLTIIAGVSGQNLTALGQRRKSAAHRISRRPANAPVDFVKDHRQPAVGARQTHLERQQEA